MKLLVVAVLLCAGCGADEVRPVVSGNAFIFNGGFVEGGTVTVLEDPSVMATTAVGDGAFRLDGLAPDSEVTLVLSFPDYVPIQTATLALGQVDLERVTFQAVHEAIFALLADMVMVTIDPTRCQIATTVTRVGKSLYDEGAHGEAGATVTIDPAPGAGSEGPIYFDARVLPDRTLVETTEDGGVVFTNVPPGRYTLRANKAGVTFSEVVITCRAGVLVNASPPWGLQAQ